MPRPRKYPPELIERTVRMVLEERRCGAPPGLTQEWAGVAVTSTNGLRGSPGSRTAVYAGQGAGRRRSARRVATSRPLRASTQPLGASGTRRAGRPLRPDAAQFPRWRTASAAPPCAPRSAGRGRRLATGRSRGTRRSRYRRSRASTGIPGSQRKRRVQDALAAECGMQQAIAAERGETELDDEQRRVARAHIDRRRLAEDERRRAVREPEPRAHVDLRRSQTTARDEATPRRHTAGEVRQGWLDHARALACRSGESIHRQSVTDTPVQRVAEAGATCGGRPTIQPKVCRSPERQPPVLLRIPWVCRLHGVHL